MQIHATSIFGTFPSNFYLPILCYINILCKIINNRIRLLQYYTYMLQFPKKWRNFNREVVETLVESWNFQNPHHWTYRNIYIKYYILLASFRKSYMAVQCHDKPYKILKFIIEFNPNFITQSVYKTSLIFNLKFIWLFDEKRAVRNIQKFWGKSVIK